jgi:hypothetical protein
LPVPPQPTPQPRPTPQPQPPSPQPTSSPRPSPQQAPISTPVPVRAVAVRTQTPSSFQSLPPGAATLGIRIMLASAGGGTRREIRDGLPLTERPDDGLNLLVARVPPTARCDSAGRLVFSVILVEGGWIPSASLGTWVITIPNACRGGGGEWTFGTTMIGGKLP